MAPRTWPKYTINYSTAKRSWDKKNGTLVPYCIPPPLEKCWRGIGLFEHRTIRDASGNFGHTGSLAPCPHQVEVSSVSAKQYVWVARGRHKNFLSTIHGGSPLSAPFWGRVISRKTLNSWNAREAGRPHRSHIPVKN